MGKSAPSVPTPPSAAETAAAQSTSNVNTAAATAALNDVNQISPYGSTTFNPTGSYTTPSGDTVPRYTQTTQLSPMGQQILGGQQQVANTLIPSAEGLAGQAANSTASPLNFKTPFSDFLNQGPQEINQQASDAIYGQQKSFLDPQWQQQSQQLQDQLSRQGIPVGSEAYNNALKQLDNARTQAYQSAQDSAVAGGSSAASNLFGMAQAGQNQNIQQQQLAQQQPISLLAQLMGATPSLPTQPISTPVPTSISPTDVVGATGISNNAAMQNYQAQLQTNNANTGAAAGLAGTVAMGALLF